VFGAARESAPATVEKSIHKTIEGDRKTKRWRIGESLWGMLEDCD
jgi:hypothetical protein